MSKGESLSNLSLEIAEDIAEIFNQEYNNLVPGVIATVELNKTTYAYAVKLKDAHHAYSHGVVYLDSINPKMSLEFRLCMASRNHP